MTESLLESASFQSTSPSASPPDAQPHSQSALTDDRLPSTGVRQTSPRDLRIEKEEQ